MAHREAPGSWVNVLLLRILDSLRNIPHDVCNQNVIFNVHLIMNGIYPLNMTSQQRPGHMHATWPLILLKHVIYKSWRPGPPLIYNSTPISLLLQHAIHTIQYVGFQESKGKYPTSNLPTGDAISGITKYTHPNITLHQVLSSPLPPYAPYFIR